MALLQRLRANDSGFDIQLQQLLAWSAVADISVESRVDEILAAVRREGDAALLQYTSQFDQLLVKSADKLELPTSRLKKALRSIGAEQKAALKAAAKRIQRYHKKQLQKDWFIKEADGTLMGQKITPLERVGVYVPGGKAAYPSTILMTVIPARVAGVKEIIMVTPTPKGAVSDMVLAAAAIAGVDRVFTVGGAQAVAALAYGTATFPKVDKIVGPGNIYVAAAKRKVFGEVAIDMVAGPSEILVISDGKGDPEWVALDLLSQAEHDEQAQSILLCPDKNFLDRVQAAIETILPTLERHAIARESLQKRAAFIEVGNLQQAVEIGNRIAPEHLELCVEDPQALLPLIRNAGAIFMGNYTSEALGDYVAGPSHVLPTSGTARFSSPLGVYDFQKRSSIIQCSAQGASELGKLASVLARSESLTAHARSAEARIKHTK